MSFFKHTCIASSCCTPSKIHFVISPRKLQNCNI